MRTFKIVSGIAFLVLTFIMATGSSFISSEPEHNASSNTPEEILLKKKESKRYKKRQKELHDALSAYFEKAIQDGDVVGAGVSIVQGDSIVIAEGYGKRSITTITKVDGETVFRLGSLSKGFAGVLAASLQNEGKLDWNDKVMDYLPTFRLGDKNNTKKITLAHILSHSSGTPYHSFTNLVEAGLPMATIAGRFNKVKPISEPGTQYSYQNAMFALSQEIMRNATGEEINELLTNRFFKPLGMSTISMDHSTLLKAENVALPHVRRKDGWRSLPLRDRYYNAVAAGGINASALDMGKWMHFLLGHQSEILDQSVIQRTFEPLVKIAYNRKYYQKWPGHKQSYYGFGWRIHTFQENEMAPETTIWHHGGSVNNYRNEIALYPDSDLGICVLLNGNSKIARTVIPDLHELVKNSFNSMSSQSNSQKIIK